MKRRSITVTSIAATLAASALFAAPASAGNVAFGLSFGVPGLSVAVGVPAYGGPVYGGGAYLAPRPVYAPYRPYYRRWHRPYAPVVVRPPVVVYPAPVVVRPRPIVYAAPYYGGY